MGDSRDGAVAAGEAEAGSNVEHEGQLVEGYEAASDADDKHKDLFVLCLSSTDKEDMNNVWQDL